MPFQKAIHQKDLSDVFICFYEPDADFERVRRNPKKYIPIFKRGAGTISTDFSVHYDMNLIKQKSQINDNLSLAYYFFSHTKPGIINIRDGSDEVNEEYYKALPHHTLVAIGTHGFVKSAASLAECYYSIEQIINTLGPSGVIVYGPLPKVIKRDFSHKTTFYQYDAWIDTDRRKRKNVK